MVRPVRAGCPDGGKADFLVIIPFSSHIYIMLKHVQFSKRRDKGWENSIYIRT